MEQNEEVANWTNLPNNVESFKASAPSDKISYMGNMDRRGIKRDGIDFQLPDEAAPKDTISKPNAVKITTGASLIPDLNILIDNMRDMDNDSYIYLHYMLPRTSEYFTPYSLKEARWDELNVLYPYFTVTRHGVTYWHVSENFFTPLDQWQQEFQQFLSIIKIRSFALFRLWKGFKVWDKTVKWRKMATARENLANSLFIAIPQLAKAILRLRSQIVQLRTLNFVNITLIEEWHPFYFLEAHMKIYEQMHKKFIGFREETGKYLFKACNDAIVARGFFPDDEVNYYPSAKKMREAHSFMDRARKRSFCKILTNFLTYCDFMMNHMLYTVAKQSVRDLTCAFERHDKVAPTETDILASPQLNQPIEAIRPENAPQHPFFLANLRLFPDRIVVEPSEDVVKLIFNRITNLILETVLEVNNFTEDCIYEQFTQPSIMGRQEECLYEVAPSLNFLFRTDKNFQLDRKNILNLIKAAYEKAQCYVQRFETIRENYEYDLKTDPNILTSERNLQILRSYCNRYCINLQALDGILDVINLGMLQITQTNLKETVTPVCQRLQLVLATSLPKMAESETARIYEVGQDFSGRVGFEPKTTLEIVAHIRLLDGCDHELNALFAEVDYVHDLFLIIKDFAIPIEDQVKEDYMDMEDYINRTEDRLRKIQEKRNNFIMQLDAVMQEDIKQLKSDIHEITMEVMEDWLLDNKSDRTSVVRKLDLLLERLNACQERADELIGYQKEFKIDITRFDEMITGLYDIRMRDNLYRTLEDWENGLSSWTEAEFGNLVVNDLIDLNSKTIKNCLQFEKYLPKNNIVPLLQQSAENFKGKLPTISYLRNPNLRARHWTDIEAVLGRKLFQEKDIKIQTYVDVHAFDDEAISESLMHISSQATGEVQLENMLKTIENVWKETELAIVSHHDQKDVFILAGTEELQTVLDDSNVNINTIAASKFLGPIKFKVDEWIMNMEQFAKTFEAWMDCQGAWIYLEAIFASADIQRQLPNEARMFYQVDKSFKDIIREAKKVALALPTMSNMQVYNALVENNTLLDLITRGLEAYLEVKRVVFPRFYFLSNDELLEILAQTRIPQAVQPHLRKCFDAIYRLEFGQKESGEGGKMIPTNDILAFLSPEGEKLMFGKGLKARGAVEEWLNKVEEAMFVTVKRYMRFGYQCYPAKEREEWFQDHPNQIVLTVSQVQWTASIHEILTQKDRNITNIIDKMVIFENKCLKDLGSLAALTRRSISSLLRKILCALITIDVHAKDSVRLLIEKQVYKYNDFNWLKMLRFYWSNETETVYSCMAAAYIPYYYEYLGASGVLVLTPLTDRCYLCLMGAFQMDLGGAPAGPAGTGKTETTKDLAKAVAKQCVVFNCSDGLDYKMMGRFFSGLAQCGAWCCFDEFNRIDIEVLSVIAQQLITIRAAKASGVKRFLFESREIKLNKSCCVFITMNPGYAGRTELPDNLKALFRPIAMMVPDYALISEVILYSEGFEDPKILARKMVQMYQLCSQQLSQQNHYDFGMRAVKSVLVMAGALKRATPNQREDITLIAALRDSNIPKFLVDDSVLFIGILSDLFPGVELPDSPHLDLERSLKIGLTTNNLQPIATILRKCLQLYETMCVRWGVMLVGPTGGGKSVVLHALEFALGHLFEEGIDDSNYRPVSIQIMNPKAVTMNELYGYVDLKTLEWQDGLLGIAVRTAVSVEEEIHQWIVNDGPVDAVWIENLNTVLDDNKMLCLANSERIKLTAWVHMLFEVQDLLQASPATVSRCGMVYIDPADLGWLPLIDTWRTVEVNKKLTPMQSECLYSLFTKHFNKALKIEKEHGAFMIHQVISSKVKLCCNLISSTIETIKWRSLNEQESKALLTKIFIWSVLWGIASNFNDDAKEVFEQMWRTALEEEPTAKLPKRSLWNYRVNIEKCEWENWGNILESFKYNPDISYYDMQVPTVDTTKFGYISELLYSRNNAIMFTGDTGVGKSVLAVSTMKKLARGNIVPVILNFSAQTSSQRTQEMVEGPLERRKRTQLGAPVGKTVIVFIDDVNMPKMDTYGSQPAIELLRQFLDFGGFYDREKLFWKEILDVVLGSACAPPGGGRNPLTPRFVRHFALLSLPKPSKETLTQIFNGILTGFFDDFSSAIRPLSESVVHACVEVYMRVAEEMLPTPDKSHYIFNLRDLSKCIQGILQANNVYHNMENQILRIFYHETTRVFHDRLINNEDKTLFNSLMSEICVKHFGKDVVKPHEQPILFGDFMVFGKPKAERIYDEIRDRVKLESVLNDYIEDFNSISLSKKMNLILFQDALVHTVRLARLLRSDRGNGLLVGVAGMGKQSLTRLASHVNEYECWQIEMRRNYDLNSFHEDLRVLYRVAGIENKPVTFLMIDSQIVEEEFLEDINNILNSGEVPNLFEGDEYEKIILDARGACNENKTEPCCRDDIYKFFINRVRNNLHVVMSMSPVGESFRRRCRMFPSLVNCTTIDWFTNWPTEALYSVALGLLTNLLNSMEDRVALASTTVYMHKTVEDASAKFYKEMKRYYYTTPSSYLELLKLYKNLLQLKNEDIIAKRKRIANGLNKLLETNEIIAVMQKELEVMVPQLDEKSVFMKMLVDNLSTESKQADIVKEGVLQDETNAKEKAAIAQAISEDAGKDLEIAMPALREAEDALKGLTKADINELKSFTTPPALVQFCMEAVCILLGAKPTWASAKLIMADMNFIKRLFEYDKEHIKEDILKKIKKYIEHKDFVPAKFEKVSKVAKSVSMWVIAMDKFSKVYKVVEPKIKRKEAAEAEFKEVMIILRQKQKELAAVEAKIQGLKDSLEEKQREFKVIQDNVDLTYGRINRAGRLTSALSEEQVRWKEAVTTLTNDLSCVPGDVLVSSACVAYLGAFSHEYRKTMIELWVQKCFEYKIQSSGEFHLLKILGDPYEMRQWTMNGLPQDNISIENGIYATRALRWPLMIDPQEQANRWIRNMEKSNNLQVIKITDSTIMRVLESAVRQGLPVLLEEIGETLDPALRPILQRETYKHEGRIYLKLGDQVIDYDNNFKLYMTTKLPNPHYLPEVCINVTLVNFLVTESGLEDQLLAEIVAIELPALEIQRNDLVMKINSDKQQLLQLEDKVLKLLFQSEGNILDDEELVETLNDAKETSLIIAARLVDTEETEKNITASREKYRMLASRGAIFYFVVAGLSEIDPMYQYSLKYFTHIFCNVIRIDHPPQKVEERIATLMVDELKAIYDNVSRGLFENHKIVFSFLLAIAIDKQEGRVSEAEFVFLTRGMVGNVKDRPKPPKIDMSKYDWQICLFLEENFPDYFSGFTNEINQPFFLQIEKNIEKFNFANTQSELSEKWNKRLKIFHKLMFISIFRKERFIFNVVVYLRETIGKYFTEASAGGTQLKMVFLDTSNITPLVFVLSTGSDPMAAFLKFAEEMKYMDKFYSISLGQGQGPIAENLIDKSLRLGHWVFLQNCHLATSWMPNMERIVRNMSLGITKSHPDFRLFLSSMPIKAFPISVLQNSVKITNEPPKGIKANIIGALADLSKDFFEKHIQNQSWRAIVFGLCMFHAVLLERRKFGPLGWNITYEFNESDRECGLKTLDFFINREIADEIPWEAILYINGEITWGGRVTDYWDQRCLRTILTIFSSERIIHPEYKYCCGDSYYRDPRKQTLVEYSNFVKSFPDIEDPEIFGMNQNANIVFQTKETQFFITTLLLGQPRLAADDEQAQENELCLQVISNIKSVLVPKIERDKIHDSMKTLDSKGQMPSLTTVLVQEIDRFNVCLKIVHASLTNLAKAISGLVVMSEELEEVFNSLLANLVPASWAKRAFLSIKPLPSYIVDFQRRIDFIKYWSEHGYPRSYWISGFFFPQSFLTGILQTYARRRVLPIDSLKIDFEVLDHELIQQDFFECHQAGRSDATLYQKLEECNDEVVNVHGIFIEAARWKSSKGGLCDAKFGELYARMPVVQFIPCLQLKPIERYEAPMYKTQQRSGVLSTTGHSTNFVLSLLLKSNKTPDFWIMRGTALVSAVIENVS